VHPASDADRHPPVVARLIRALALPVVLGWVALTLLVTFAVPSLERVSREQAVPMSPRDAPSVAAMIRMGQAFGESDSDSTAMVVLESDRPLDDEARDYYARLVTEFRADPEHIQHVQDLWVADSDVIVVPKTHARISTDFIGEIFTRGIYGVMPFQGISLNFAKMSTL